MSQGRVYLKNDFGAEKDQNSSHEGFLRRELSSEIFQVFSLSNSFAILKCAFRFLLFFKFWQDFYDTVQKTLSTYLRCMGGDLDSCGYIDDILPYCPYLYVSISHLP